MAYSYYRQPPYQPGQTTPYKLSRSKIDLFMQCPRCFYLETRMGIKRVGMAPFLLNSAVDQLLKNEFDVHRAKHEPHPLQTQFKIDAIPAEHEQLNVWRENFKGIQHTYAPANLLITGAIDDLWINPAGEYIVVDYKATAKNGKVDNLNDTKWHDQYRRQMEIYQWLLRQVGLTVSDTGYFVYCNGVKDKNEFDGHLDFEIFVFPYVGKGDWIEPTLAKIRETMESEIVPKPAGDCEHCAYAKARTEMTLKALQNQKK